MIRLLIALRRLVCSRWSQPRQPQPRPHSAASRFPTPAAPAAQAEFLRGVAWLHSFMYEDAIDAFRAAQKIDPYVRAGLLGRGDELQPAAVVLRGSRQGRAALAKLGADPGGARSRRRRRRASRGSCAPSRRCSGRATSRRAAAAHAEEMAKVAAEHPADDEAQTFYALALLATLPRGDAALPLRQQAGAIAEKVFARNPKHPGRRALHPARLRSRRAGARRRCRRRAPTRRSRRRRATRCTCPRTRSCSSGFWDEAAATDEASWNASIAWAKRRGLPIASRDFHSLSWLQYEWTQQGRFSKTKEAIAFVDRGAEGRLKASGPQASSRPARRRPRLRRASEIGRGSSEAALRNDRGSMRARYIIESERWQEMKGQSTFDNIEELFALGLSAVNLGDARARARR